MIKLRSKSWSEYLHAYIYIYTVNGYTWKIDNDRIEEENTNQASDAPPPKKKTNKENRVLFHFL